MVVVSHHPLVSGGQHGGYFDWPTYLFPLHPWARQAGAFARQDVSGREYRNMIAAISRAYSPVAPLVHAAGHEHNLQLIRGVGAKYQVVSGAGIYNHTTQTRAIPGTFYARRASVCVTIVFLRDGRVRMAYRIVNQDGTYREDYSTWLDVPPLVPTDQARPTPVPATPSSGTGVAPAGAQRNRPAPDSTSVRPVAPGPPNTTPAPTAPPPTTPTPTAPPAPAPAGARP